MRRLQCAPQRSAATMYMAVAGAWPASWRAVAIYPRAVGEHDGRETYDRDVSSPRTTEVRCDPLHTGSYPCSELGGTGKPSMRMLSCHSVLRRPRIPNQLTSTSFVRLGPRAPC